MMYALRAAFARVTPGAKPHGASCVFQADLWGAGLPELRFR